MRTARPGGGRPGIEKAGPENSSFAIPASAPQRPISRRAPNRPFRDEVPAPSELGGLTVGVTGGGCRLLAALLSEEAR